jgi:uncharacterized RDD family membrane protein YckC
MADASEDEGLRGSMRRAVEGAFDATVGRVGEAAVDVTGTTAQQVIEELEPYLVEEAIPRIVDGITPYLIDELVPRVVDGVQGHLVEVTVPEVVEGITPQLVDQLLPRILADLRPYLEQELVPPIVDALMPRIEEQIAPGLVDALMPKIRNDVVPTILDDIVDDPRVRDLIREQSQGLFLDALESVRENLADADNLVERIARRILRRPMRPEQDSAVALVVHATGGGQTVALRRTLDDFAAQRRSWDSMPMPPAPPGREFAHAGLVTRLLALLFDLGVTAWLISQGLSAAVGLLDTLLDPIPTWLTVGLTGIAASFVPLYLTLAWWLGGRTLGMWLVGIRVCTADGMNPGFPRSLFRAWAMLLGLVIWVWTALLSLVDPKRRTLFDRLTRTEVRYVVPINQQHRYIREAAQALRSGASADGTPGEADASGADGAEGLAVP